MAKNSKPEWKVIVDLLRKVDELLFDRIIRRMIYYLYSREVKEIYELIESLETNYKRTNSTDGVLYENVPAPKSDKTAFTKVADHVFKIAEDSLPDEEITEQVRLWLAQDRTRFLSISFEKRNISLTDAIDELNRFFNIPRSEVFMSKEEFISIRTYLIRRFLSTNLQYIVNAKEYITIKDFGDLLKTVIGPGQGSGSLGGKSSGLILACRIIKNAMNEHPELKTIKVPRSWYVTSDTIMDFIHFNALEEIISFKYMSMEQIRAGYAYLIQLFKNAFWSPEIVRQFSVMLDEIGDKPIIVRSSSLLEDSFEAAFSGKYKSLFLSNTGTYEERLSALLDAIAEIYASVFSPDPIEYRRERGLLDFNEEMGLLIQEVVGNRIGDYFFPTFSGVAFSKNEFRWSSRIETDDGVARLVAGLGTRAVDRIGDDYPCLASPGKPGLKVNISDDERIKYSQRKMDIINLKEGKFETLPISKIIDNLGDEIPGLEKIVSINKSGTLSAPSGIIFDLSDKDLLVTFQGLMDNPPFLKQIHLLMKVLSKALNTPVDIEFAHDGKNLYILQCRPQMYSSFTETVIIPADIPEEKIIFTANKYITTGSVKDIEYIIYVGHKEYDALPSQSDMRKVAETISKLNQILPKRKFILIGPGRWGSRGDIKLGVPVTYSGINNTSMLIEVAYNKDGYIPELSFGTHFFQDLVESDIKYLPLYPEEDKNIFDKEKIKKTKNRLSDLIPDSSNLADVVRVVKVTDLLKSSNLQVLMDGDKNKAIAYLEEKK